jgi:hypothetical protein
MTLQYLIEYQITENNVTLFYEMRCIPIKIFIQIQRHKDFLFLNFICRLI